MAFRVSIVFESVHVIVMNDEFSFLKPYFRRVVGAVHMHKNIVGIGKCPISCLCFDGIARLIRYLEGEMEDLSIIASVIHAFRHVPDDISIGIHQEGEPVLCALLIGERFELNGLVGNDKDTVIVAVELHLAQLFGTEILLELAPLHRKGHTERVACNPLQQADIGNEVASLHAARTAGLIIHTCVYRFEGQTVSKIRIFQCKRQPCRRPRGATGLLIEVRTMVARVCFSKIWVIFSVIRLFYAVCTFCLGIYPQVSVVVPSLTCLMEPAFVVGALDDHDHFLRGRHAVHRRGEIEALMYLKAVGQRVGGIVIQLELIFTGRFVHDKVAVIRMDGDGIATHDRRFTLQLVPSRNVPRVLRGPELHARHRAFHLACGGIVSVNSNLFTVFIDADTRLLHMHGSLAHKDGQCGGRGGIAVGIRDGVRELLALDGIFGNHDFLIKHIMIGAVSLDIQGAELALYLCEALTAVNGRPLHLCDKRGSVRTPRIIVKNVAFGIILPVLTTLLQLKGIVMRIGIAVPNRDVHGNDMLLAVFIRNGKLMRQRDAVAVLLMGIGCALLKEELVAGESKLTDKRLSLKYLCPVANLLDTRHVGDLHRMGRPALLQQVIVKA